ncbi:MAG TPA: 16S rRNA (uracil(1498)-N(3))-methyltransferase [Steroidobacteraceae bacterium]|jgi:16S rRNA (uracil1498-N3)-methyltransferase
MRVTRCFVPAPLRTGELRLLPAPVARHVAQVLRAQVGDELTLFDGRGGEYPAQIIELGARAVRVRVEQHHALERESPVSITLLQALARTERMDLIVQKATELGVAAILVWPAERSVARLVGAAVAKRCDHWRAIAIAACEQCGRNRIPRLELITGLSSACTAAATVGALDGKLLLDPEASESLAAVLPSGRSADGLERLQLLIGPEGGISPAEFAQAAAAGFRPCRLGPRVLRTETAPLAALAAIQTLAGDFRR